MFKDKIKSILRMFHLVFSATMIAIYVEIKPKSSQNVLQKIMINKKIQQNGLSIMKKVFS